MTLLGESILLLHYGLMRANIILPADVCITLVTVTNALSDI